MNEGSYATIFLFIIMKSDSKLVGKEEKVFSHVNGSWQKVNGREMAYLFTVLPIH